MPTAAEIFARVEYHKGWDPKTRTLRKAAGMSSDHEWDNLIIREHALPHKNIAASVQRCKTELDEAEKNGAAGKFGVIAQVTKILADELSATLLGPDGKPSISDKMIDAQVSAAPREWGEKKRSAVREALIEEVGKVRTALLATMERADTLLASAPQLEKMRAMRENRVRIADTPEAAALQAELAECLRTQAAMIRKGHRFLSSDAQRYEGEALARRITELQVALEPRYQPIQ